MLLYFSERSRAVQWRPGFLKLLRCSDLKVCLKIQGDWVIELQFSEKRVVWLSKSPSILVYLGGWRSVISVGCLYVEVMTKFRWYTSKPNWYTADVYGASHWSFVNPRWRWGKFDWASPDVPANTPAPPAHAWRALVYCGMGWRCRRDSESNLGGSLESKSLERERERNI